MQLTQFQMVKFTCQMEVEGAANVAPGNVIH